MKNIILVGAGKISKKYKKAFEMLGFNLLAIVEVQDKPLSDIHFKNVPIYSSLSDLKHLEADFVLISTPPSTHFKMIKEALSYGFNVLIEKPAVINLSDFNEIIKLKSSTKKDVKTMLHWQFADEILYFKNNLKISNFKSIEITIDEPYASNHQLNQKLYNSGGVYIDGHVNVLSFLDLFLDLNRLELISKKEELDNAFKLIVKSELLYNYNDKNITINYDWTKSNNYTKITRIFFNNGQIIEIDHNNQTINKNGEIIKLDFHDRLEKHYINLFKNINLLEQLEDQKLIYVKLFEVI